jgi:hypothetical protein
MTVPTTSMVQKDREAVPVGGADDPWELATALKTSPREAVI